MAVIIEELLVRLDATSDLLVKELKKAGVDLDQFGIRAGKSASAADRAFAGARNGLSAFSGALNLVIGAAGAGGLVELTRRAIETVGSFGEMSQQLGISSDTLQAFNYAATQVGLSQDELQTGIAKLTKTVGDATEGNKAAIDSLDRYGIKILDVRGKVRSTEDVLRDVADAIARAKSPAEQAAIALDFFGKTGQKLIPFLRDGAAGVDQLVQKAKDLGLVFSEDQIRRTDELSDKMSAFGLVLKTDVYSAVLQLAPAISELFDDLNKGVNDSRESLEHFAEFLHRLLGSPDAAEQLGNINRQIAETSAAIERARTDQAAASLIDPLEQRLQTLRDEATALGAKLSGTAQIKRDGGRAGDPMGPETGVSNPPPTGQTEAEKQIERMKTKVEDLRIALQEFDGDTLGAKIAKNLEGFDLAVPGAAALAAQIRDLTTAGYNAAEMQETLNQAEERANALYDEAQTVIASVRNPVEDYYNTLERLAVLLDTNSINQEVFNRALKRARDEMNESLGFPDQLKLSIGELQQFGDQAFDRIGSAMTENAVEGESAWEKWKNVGLGAISEIEQEAVKLALINPIKNWINGNSALPTGGGILQSLFGLFSGSIGPTSISMGGGPGGFFKDGGISTAAGRVRLRRFAAGGAGGVAHSPQLNEIAENGVPEAYVPVPSGRIPVELRGGGQGAGDITINAPVTVNANGGTQAQNADLADKMSVALTRTLNGAIDARIAHHKRAGNLLNPTGGL